MCHGLKIIAVTCVWRAADTSSELSSLLFFNETVRPWWSYIKLVNSLRINNFKQSPFGSVQLNIFVKRKDSL